MKLNPKNQYRSVCADTLFPSCEAKFLCCCCLDGYVVNVDIHNIGKAFLHRLHMGIYLWTFRTNGCVDVPYMIALCGYKVYGFLEKYLTVYVEGVCRGVREVITDVSHVCCSKQSVTDSMYKNIGIAVAKQAEGVGNLYSTKPKFSVMY